MKLIRLLKKELAADAADWVADGLLSSEQAESVLARYGTRLPNGEERSYGYQVLIGMAALFFGLALIVLVSANWDEVPRAIRMGGLLLITLAFHGTGLFHYVKENSRNAIIFFFLGSLSYGTSIFLIAQIYHLGEHFPDGIFYWALGILPFALLTESLMLMLLTSAVAGIWLYVESTNGFFPIAYPLFAVTGLWFALSKKQSLVLFLGVLASTIFFSEYLLSGLLGGHFYHFDLNTHHFFYTPGLFILLFLLGKVLSEDHYSERLKDYGLALRLWTTRFGLLVLFLLSNSGPWKELVRNLRDEGAFVALWSVVVAIVIALTLSITKQHKQNYSVIGHGSFFLIVSILLSLEGRIDFGTLVFTAMILSNCFLLLSGVWLLWGGLKTQSRSSFTLGLFVLVILALLRYFDLIGGYIGGSLSFFIAACFLFITARLWKSQTNKMRRLQC